MFVYKGIFLFSPLPKELGTCVFIVSKANYYLKRFLNILSTNMPTEFLNDINDKGGFHRHDDLIDSHIKDSIPYIDF